LLITRLCFCCGETELFSYLQIVLSALSLNMTTLSADDLKKLIREAVKEAVSEALQQVNTRLDQIDAAVSVLRLDLDTRTRTVSLLQDENRVLRTKMGELERKIDSTEQYNKRDNLLFVGLPTNAAGVAGADTMAETSMTLTESVLNITNNILKVPITKDDISVVHRIPQKNASANNSSPVVIRFTKRSTRDEVYNARFELKGKNIGFRLYINEDLSTVNQKIFSVLHKKFMDKKIQGAWTKNCKVLCKKNNSGSVVHVTSVAQANTIDS
jgi:uncharacterized protein YigA (DUF484 family)